MLKIKRNDKVLVVTGKDKGKVGKVLRVFHQKERILVEKINMAKKAKRKTQDNPQGGFVELEVPVHVSNVMLLDKKTNQRTRFKTAILKDGSKMRMSKKSGEGF
jgi:large subunit ribosomal protein L24